MGRVQPSRSNGLGKEVKRKLSPTREVNGPVLARSLQRLVKTPSTRTEEEMEGQPKSMGVDKNAGRTGLGKEKIGFKPNQGDSVKGKKALARARALQANSPSAARAERGKSVPLFQRTQTRLALNFDGDQQPGVPPGFQFTAATCPETDWKMDGNENSELRNGLELCDADGASSPSGDAAGSADGPLLAAAEPDGLCSMQEEPNGVAIRTDQSPGLCSMQEETSGNSRRADQYASVVEEGEDGDADMVLERGGDGGAGR